MHLVVSSSAQLLALATGTSARRRRRAAEALLVDEVAARASTAQLQLDYSSRSLVELVLLTVTETPTASAASGGTSSVTVGGQSTAILQVAMGLYGVDIALSVTVSIVRYSIFLLTDDVMPL